MNTPLGSAESLMPALVEADEDIKAGRLSRSFSTHREFIAHLHKAAKKPGSQ